ncbi:FAD-dependent monooxygenase [Streptomyces sp. NPDC088729]|uniref:FAD-dependent monooxygenase n=1 Tax=Streptomyces sp. NPDC088729 TaxID=3365876 RepID=UPI0037F1673E
MGAGPVGLVLACELARREIPVRVVDRLPRPTDQSRAIVVHARTLEALERVGALDDFLAAGIRASAVEMHDGPNVLAHVELDTVDSPFPFSLVLPQTDTELILTRRLRSLGVRIERGVTLTEFAQDGDGARARLSLPDGGGETAETPWIAGADGSHSTVRAGTGQRLVGSFTGERFLLADVEATHRLDPSAIHTFFPPEGGGPLLVFPMRERRVRVIAQVPLDTPTTEPTPAQVQDVLDARAGGIAVTSTHWSTVFDIHHAQVPRYRRGRALLLGDAAHIHSPAGGQGMNTGMQDAFNLAWKLAAVVRGEAASELLDSYHAERHPVAQRVIEQTTRLTDLGTLRRPAERTVRNILLHTASGLAPLKHGVADMTEEITVNYRHSPLVVRGERGHGPQPGDAAPDVRTAEGQPPWHSLLAEGPGHTVVTVLPESLDADARPAPPGTPPGTRRLLVGDEPGPGVDVVDPQRRIARRYGFGAHGGTFVVRPDGYLASIGRDGRGTTAAEDYFVRRATGRPLSQPL